MANDEVFGRLRERLVKLDVEGVQRATQEALASGASAQDIVTRGLAPGMEHIGQGYERGELFIPELLLSAKAMRTAMKLLEPHLREGGVASRGKIVLGTVQGDVHDIGKNIVGLVLESDGIEVVDLGVDVPPERFLEVAEEVGADVVAISALISLAVSKMAETIAFLKERKIPAKVLVGGAAVTRETAVSIGADAHGKDAWEAVRMARGLVCGHHQP